MAATGQLSKPTRAATGKRVGRGPGSGHGKTASRGSKGQYASAGAEVFTRLLARRFCEQITNHP